MNYVMINKLTAISNQDKSPWRPLNYLFTHLTSIYGKSLTYQKQELELPRINQWYRNQVLFEIRVLKETTAIIDKMIKGN